MKTIRNNDEAAASTGADAHANVLRDRLLAAGATEDSLLAELRHLRGKDDGDIDLSDIPEMSDSDWDGVVREKFYRPSK